MHNAIVESSLYELYFWCDNFDIQAGWILKQSIMDRIYFTHEAVQIFKESTLRTPAPLPELSTKRRPTIGRFFIDQLAKQAEEESRRKQHDRLLLTSSEMSAFDLKMIAKPKEDFPRYCEDAKAPEISLKAFKEKMELIKVGKERANAAAGMRYQSRRTYFRHAILPASLEDMIQKDLMDYSLKLDMRPTEDEVKLCNDLVAIPSAVKFRRNTNLEEDRGEQADDE